MATQLVSIRDCERDIGDAHITRSLGREGALLHAIAMSTAALVVNIPPLRSGLVTLKADRDEPDRLTTSVVDHIFSKKKSIACSSSPEPSSSLMMILFFL